MLKFTIKADPVSINKAYSTNSQGRRFLTGEGKSFKHSCYWDTYHASRGLKALFKYPIEVHLDFYLNNRLRVDLDNIVKLTIDGICGSKYDRKLVFQDDREIKRLELEKFYDPENTRIEVTIIQLEN